MRSPVCSYILGWCLDGTKLYKGLTPLLYVGRRREWRGLQECVPGESGPEVPPLFACYFHTDTSNSHTQPQQLYFLLNNSTNMPNTRERRGQVNNDLKTKISTSSEWIVGAAEGAKCSPRVPRLSVLGSIPSTWPSIQSCLSWTSSWWWPRRQRPGRLVGPQEHLVLLW